MLRPILRLSALSLALAACSSQNTRPVIASSASQPAYAIKYADSVATTNKSLAERQTEEKQLSGSFGARIDELKKPDWDRVLTVIEQADEAGKSAGYAEAHSEANAVHAFWADERETISGKVGGNAQYAAKQGGCTVDVSGAAIFALKESIEKQLEKRQRAKNDAFVTLERYKTSLGRENIASLEKLADDIAQASYIVNVQLPEQREQLRDELSERSSVDRALERFIKDERAFQAEAGRTDAEKKASDDRIATATKSRADLAEATAEGDATMKSIDAQIEAATKDYKDSLKALKDKVADKKKAV